MYLWTFSLPTSADSHKGPFRHLIAAYFICKQFSFIINDLVLDLGYRMKGHLIILLFFVPRKSIYYQTSLLISKPTVNLYYCVVICFTYTILYYCVI